MPRTFGRVGNRVPDIVSDVSDGGAPTDPYELNNIASKGLPPDLPKALNAMENCHTAATCWAAAHLS